MAPEDVISEAHRVADKTQPGKPPARARDMVVRRLEHPESGRTAEIEFPLGWSRSKFYRVTTFETSGEVVGVPEIIVCESSSAARDAAVARERAAIERGWVIKQPRKQANQTNVGQLFHRNGNPLPFTVLSVDVGESEIESVGMLDWTKGWAERRTRGERHVVFSCHADAPPTTIAIGVGHRIFWSYKQANGQALRAAVVVNSVQQELSFSGRDTWRIEGHIRQQSPEEQAVVLATASREMVISQLVRGADFDLSAAWEALAETVPNVQERQEVINQIVVTRAERQQAAIEAARLEQEALEARRELEAARREQERNREAMLREERELAAAARRERLRIREQLDREAEQKHLTGGEPLGKRKKRKVDLE